MTDDVSRQEILAFMRSLPVEDAEGIMRVFGLLSEFKDPLYICFPEFMERLNSKQMTETDRVHLTKLLHTLSTISSESPKVNDKNEGQSLSAAPVIGHL